MKKIVFAALIFCSSIYAQDTKKAIFLGNSYTGVNNLPNLIKQCALSVDDTLIFSANTPGGYTLEGHSTNGTSLALINSTGWDYCILQDQSQRPSFSDSQVEAEVYPFAKKLDSIFSANNECGETLFYMTWGRKNGDASNCPVWPPVCTYNGMDSLLNLRYRTMAADNNAEVSPVGEVWHYIRDNYPGIELYSGDESHPSAAGSYAAAITFYTAIFKKDPTLITYDFSVSAADAEIIRQAAKVVVYDDLLEWHIGEYDATPLYSYAPTTGFSYAFTNESLNYTSVKWIIDGTDYSIENPTHTFPASGFYDVVLTAMNACDTIQKSENIAIGVASVKEEGSFQLNLYPNPTKTSIIVQFDSEQSMDLVIYSLDGKIAKSIKVISGEEVNVEALDKGIYLVNIISEEGLEISKRLVKN